MSALRLAANAASTCGTCSGSRSRASAVDDRSFGTATTGRIAGWGRSRWARNVEPDCHATTKPPSRLAAALSACPSNSAASCNAASSMSLPANAYPAATPATTAAAEDPSPRECGMALRQRRARPGTLTSRYRQACRNARTTRCDSSVGTADMSPAPASITSTCRPDSVTVTSMTSCNPNAMPNVSNPEPTFAVDAGTVIVYFTPTLIPGLFDAPLPRGGGARIGALRQFQCRRDRTRVDGERLDLHVASRAVAGSFSPCPVTVHTTVDPFGNRPSAAVNNRPATLVAEAGSTNTPSRRASSR